MTTYNWEGEIVAWTSKHRNIAAGQQKDILRFFETAFLHTSHPERAWFGAHQHTLSLVIGGIFLAAINDAYIDRGLWLLVDSDELSINGWSYVPAKSTLQSIAPLFWLHTDTVSNISFVTQNEDVWDHYALATQKILLSRRVAADRDAHQMNRGKRRLSEFYSDANLEIQSLYGEEYESDEPLNEGTVYRVFVNAYERNSEARRKCIAHFGAECAICGFDFGEKYGEPGRGLIHVHHLRQLADIRQDYCVDPLADLLPVCANCHAMIHRRKPPYKVQDIKSMLQREAPLD